MLWSIDTCQIKSGYPLLSSLELVEVTCFVMLTADQVPVFGWTAGSCHANLFSIVVRKPAKASPGLRVNQSINCFCIQVFSLLLLCSLRLLKLNTEGTSTQSYKTQIKILAYPGLT